jgi:hypothetical protein
LVGITHTFSRDGWSDDIVPKKTAFLNRWLATPRDDGKPRVLILPVDYYIVQTVDNIPHFIEDKFKEVICNFILVQIFARVNLSSD